MRRKTLEIFVTTLTLTTLVVAFATIIGVTMAWILHSVALPFPNLSRALVILPIAIPSYVFTFCWISLFPELQGFWAAVFILVLSTTPFVILAALSALRRVDWSQHEVAQTLGLNTFATFFQVTLPQIRNSVTAGSLLVALYVLSDFGAVSLLGVDTLLAQSPTFTAVHSIEVLLRSWLSYLWLSRESSSRLKAEPDHTLRTSEVRPE